MCLAGETFGSILRTGKVRINTEMPKGKKEGWVERWPSVRCTRTQLPVDEEMGSRFPIHGYLGSWSRMGV